MKKRRKREKSRKKDKRTMVLLLVVAFVIIIAVATILYQSARQNSPSRPSAEEFFDFLDPTPEGTLSEDGTQLLMYSLNFKIKAVGGDAHEVFANSGGLGMVEPTWVGTILEGEERSVTLFFPEYPVNLRLKGQEFSVTLRITSVEASGLVTISFPPPEPKNST